MGSIEQFAVAARVTGDIGESLDKRREALARDVQKFIGANETLKLMAKNLDTVMLAIERDKDDGVLAKRLAEGGEYADLPLDIALARYAKSRVQVCIEATLNFAEQQKSNELVTNGQVIALQEAIVLIAKHHQVAVARHTQLTAPPEPEPADGEARGAERAPGERPGPSSLDERRAEAAEAKKAAAAATVEPPAVLNVEPEAPARRSRKSRVTSRR